MSISETSRFSERGAAFGGFALAELLLALCCLGLVLAPFVLYLRQAGLLQHEGSERGRVLAWGAYQRQVVGQGVDPAQSGHFQAEHPLVMGRVTEAVGRGDVLGLGGAGRVVVLSNRVSFTGAEAVLGGAGLELRAAEALAPVVVPERAAKVIVMSSPLVSPVSGSVLVPAQIPGGKLALRVDSAEGARVVLELSKPSVSSSAVGTLGLVVSADDLAAGLEGAAWAEYPGVESAAQQGVELEDGRKAWYVEEAGAVNRYMPSERVGVRYVLDLGRPVLVLGSVEYADGSAVPVDYRTVVGVRSGGVEMRIQWPDTVLSLFKELPAGLGGFAVSFGHESGDNASLRSLVFGEARLGLWGARMELGAEAVVPAGCRASPATWFLERQVLSLPQPERVVQPSVAEAPEVPGLFDFRAADLSGLGRVGRLSARGGAVLSVGGSLSLEEQP